MFFKWTHYLFKHIIYLNKLGPMTQSKSDPSGHKCVCDFLCGPHAAGNCLICFPGEARLISNKPSVWIAPQASNTVTELHLSTNDSRLPAGWAALPQSARAGRYIARTQTLWSRCQEPSNSSDWPLEAKAPTSKTIIELKHTGPVSLCVWTARCALVQAGEYLKRKISLLNTSDLLQARYSVQRHCLLPFAAICLI